MNHRIKEFVKNNKVIYWLYYHTLSLFVNFLKLFVKTDNKLILFVSYGGRHYSDSPRVIYEAMLSDERFKDYKMIWAFVDPKKYNVKFKIKIDTLSYYKTALKARCWVTNVAIERALNFRGKKTYYFYTTHGILPKCDGADVKGKKFTSKAKRQYDCCLAQSEIEKDICLHISGIPEKNVKILGCPKDDILVHHTKEFRQKIRKELGIPQDKKAILYAPTFREGRNLTESFVIDVEKWRKQLSPNFVLLYRAHPVVSSKSKIDNSFFIDVTKYEVVEELMIASDVLVSDYSGIIFDYCIMHKPIFLWTYDYEEYQKKRGLYFDIRKELKYSASESEIIEMILNHNWETIPTEVVKFQEKYETEFGSGTINSINDIWNSIN